MHVHFPRAFAAMVALLSLASCDPEDRPGHDAEVEDRDEGVGHVDEGPEGEFDGDVADDEGPDGEDQDEGADVADDEGPDGDLDAGLADDEGADVADDEGPDGDLDAGLPNDEGPDGVPDDEGVDGDDV